MKIIVRIIFLILLFLVNKIIFSIIRPKEKRIKGKINKTARFIVTGFNEKTILRMKVVVSMIRNFFSSEYFFIRKIEMIKVIKVSGQIIGKISAKRLRFDRFGWIEMEYI